MSDAASSFLIESAVWQPGTLWACAMEHLAARFGRVRVLDVTTLPEPDPTAADPLGPPIASLEAWSHGEIEWARELARYFDDHLSLHVRPDTRVTRALRAAAQDGDLLAVTRLPIPAAESVLAHAGVRRAVSHVRHVPSDEALPAAARSVDALTTTAS
jgi:hypothetical protein